MRRVGGRFVLVRELGVGGISRVYLGRDEVLDRPVAVKILHPDLDDEETGDRFRREGRTAAKLSHPNIVQVYDAGEDAMEGRKVSYIVMEYVSGGDLKALMDRRGSLPEGMLSRLGADVAGALAHAHERGVIHRDVKPQNVLLDDRGNPKLSDFGIARALETATTPQTRTGSYLGTAAYSSPEQLRGDKVTPKADVYALGTTLYHAAAGEPPFSGAPIEVANQHILKKPTPPRERGAPVGRGFETLVLDCLHKDPSKRPDASRVHQKLLQRRGAAPNAAVPATPGTGGGRRAAKVSGSAGPAGDGGISRAVGAARSAGASGLGSVRRRLDRAPSPGAEGPPDETISFPTRTFRSGSRRRVLILLAGAVLVLLLLAGGIWALLGPGGETTRSPNGGSNEQRQAAAAGQPEEKVDEAPKQEPANDPTGSASEGGSGGGPEAGAESEAPAPPLDEARQAVFDLYVDMSYREVETTWNALSSRLQDEIGSPQAWAEQEGIYTFTYMEYTQIPQAEAAGDEARVSFEARLDREEGSEILSGTWVCVNEGGEWKLDRLEDESSTPA